LFCYVAGMARTSRHSRKIRPRWWTALNSPLALLLISGVVIGGAVKWYDSHQNAVEDQTARRSKLAHLLTEYQHRISTLGSLNSRLDLPSPTSAATQKKLDPCSAEYRAFERLSGDIGRQEWNVIRGQGIYVPTAPQFKGVNIQAIAAEIEDTAGIPDVQLGSIRMLGLLNADPDIIWVFVAGHLPEMEKFGITRHLLYVSGEIPLLRGNSLTVRQQRMLGFPEPQPDDARRRTDIMQRLDKTIQELESGEPVKCPT